MKHGLIYEAGWVKCSPIQPSLMPDRSTYTIWISLEKQNEMKYQQVAEPFWGRLYLHDTRTLQRTTEEMNLSHRMCVWIAFKCKQLGLADVHPLGGESFK